MTDYNLRIVDNKNGTFPIGFVSCLGKLKMV